MARYRSLAFGREVLTLNGISFLLALVERKKKRDTVKKVFLAAAGYVYEYAQLPKFYVVWLNASFKRTIVYNTGAKINGGNE